MAGKLKLGWLRGGAADTAFAANAERARRAGEPARAVQLCREGLQRFPDQLSARVTLGWALMDLEQYDEARAELKRVLERAPDNLAAIRGMAELHDRSENAMLLSIEHASDWPPTSEEIANAAADVESHRDQVSPAPATPAPQAEGELSPEEIEAVLAESEAIEADADRVESGLPAVEAVRPTEPDAVMPEMAAGETLDEAASAAAAQAEAEPLVLDANEVTVLDLGAGDQELLPDIVFPEWPAEPAWTDALAHALSEVEAGGSGDSRVSEAKARNPLRTEATAPSAPGQTGAEAPLDAVVDLAGTPESGLDQVIAELAAEETGVDRSREPDPDPPAGVAVEPSSSVDAAGAGSADEDSPAEPTELGDMSSLEALEHFLRQVEARRLRVSGESAA